MFKKIGEMLTGFAALLFPADEQAAVRHPEDYFELVEQARRDWRDARSRFDQIADPDLIDHAIFALEATERRYMYLLKKAREEGFHRRCEELPRKTELKGRG